MKKRTDFLPPRFSCFELSSSIQKVHPYHMTHGSLDREAHDSFIRLPHSAHLLPKSSSSSSTTRPPSLQLRRLTAALATPPPRSPTTVVALDTLLDSPPATIPSHLGSRPSERRRKKRISGPCQRSRGRACHPVYFSDPKAPRREICSQAHDAITGPTPPRVHQKCQTSSPTDGHRSGPEHAGPRRRLTMCPLQLWVIMKQVKIRRVSKSNTEHQNVPYCTVLSIYYFTTIRSEPTGTPYRSSRA
jgi:hypothetical protein